MALRRSEGGRRGASSVLVVVGLANPGPEYEGTRHNAGGDAVRLVAARRGATLSLEKRQRCLSASISTPRGLVTLAVPTTFMNESGSAIPPLLNRTSLEDLEHLVIAHDELDLEPGRLQFKLGGGLAGHNGLRSIAQTLGTHDFARLRIGVGRPPGRQSGADYVLARLTGARRDAQAEVVERAADALETLLDYDLAEAQRRVNGTRA